MIDADLASWLKLSQVPGLGNEGFRNLLLAFESPEKILETPVSALMEIVSKKVANAIASSSEVTLPDNISDWINDPLNHVVTLGDHSYPRLLLNIPDPPVLLYIKGRLDLLNHSSIAIVGSRNASVQGIRNAESFSQALSEIDLCIVSGMAHGIDTAAHLGGLRGTGSSIAVIGTGLDKVYPSSNRDLAHELASKGTLISEYPLGTPPLASNFPRRNRIISGLSLGCLVVEASLQSGSLITARMALEQGRDVYAIPGSIHSPHAKGCHALIKQGAKLVETPQNILDELRLNLPKVNSTENNQSEHPIFAHLGFDPVDLDNLSLRSGLTVEDLSAILLQLELNGQVATLAGGLYQRIV